MRRLTTTLSFHSNTVETSLASLTGTWVPGGGQILPEKSKGMKKSEITKMKQEREAKLLKENRKRIEEIKKTRVEMAEKKRKAEEIR